MSLSGRSQLPLRDHWVLRSWCSKLLSQCAGRHDSLGAVSFTLENVFEGRLSFVLPRINRVAKN